MTASGPLERLRAGTAAVPLRIKLVGALMALATGGLAVAAVATTASLHNYLVNRVDDQLRTFAAGAGTRDYQVHIIGGAGFPGPGPQTKPSGGLSVGGQASGESTSTDSPPRLPSEFYVAQYGPTGQRVGIINLQLESQSPPKLPELTLATATALSHHAFTVPSVNGKSSWRVVTVVRPDGSGSVVVASSLSDVNHTTDHVILLETAIGLVALLLIGLAGYVVINRSLRPLVAVEHTAAAIADGDLTQRVPQLPERTEVGRLSAALNTMLSQIETAFAHERESQQQARASEERMRQFIADASHELRTPLTSIRGFAELFRMGATTEEMDLPHLMNRIETEAARMGLMVEDLLLLARLDQQRPLAHEPVDLLVIATDAVTDGKVVAPERQISLDLQAADPPTVIGDESRLRQVVHNLISNALTHTPAGTPIDVSVATQADPTPVAILTVADRGPGVNNDQARRVFERFYRVDTSRNRQAGGSGLGLSIVAGLVAAHDGTVTVSPRPGGGAVFMVTLPLSREVTSSGGA